MLKIKIPPFEIYRKTGNKFSRYHFRWRKAPQTRVSYNGGTRPLLLFSCCVNFLRPLGSEFTFFALPRFHQSPWLSLQKAAKSYCSSSKRLNIKYKNIINYDSNFHWDLSSFFNICPTEKRTKVLPYSASKSISSILASLQRRSRE